MASFRALDSGRVAPRPATPTDGEGSIYSVALAASAPSFVALSPQFRTPTASGGIHQTASAPSHRPFASSRTSQGPPLKCSAYFADEPADNSPEVLEFSPLGRAFPVLAALLAPCRAEGTISLDAVHVTTNTTIHSRECAAARLGSAALLDTGSPQAFTPRDALFRMLLVRIVSAACEKFYHPRSWCGLGESAPLQTPASVRLSIQLLRTDGPMCSPAAWAWMVPPSIIQETVLPGRDSWIRFNTPPLSLSFPLSPGQSDTWRARVSHQVLMRV